MDTPIHVLRIAKPSRVVFKGTNDVAFKDSVHFFSGKPFLVADFWVNLCSRTILKGSDLFPGVYNKSVNILVCFSLELIHSQINRNNAWSLKNLQRIERSNKRLIDFTYVLVELCLWLPFKQHTLILIFCVLNKKLLENFHLPVERIGQSAPQNNTEVVGNYVKRFLHSSRKSLT